jgi:acyl-coenzyme A synthetase/AMP-(fatty) acid ligase
LINQLRQKKKAGVVIFTSGTTGKKKAALFDIEKLFLKYFNKPARPYRTLTFLNLDHIGGINTVCSILTSGGTIITAKDKSVKSVCSAIEQHEVQLLPTTPTFLHMLLISHAQELYDLSSLKMITYGTEPMPEFLLKELHKALPNVKLKQTYGATEFGILSTQSLSSDSTWMKIGGPNTDIQIKEGTLWVRTDLAMLGYLNSPSPFQDQGWYNTKDKVEVCNDYFRILGRDTDIINVGGEKVNPIEIENLLMQLPNVLNVLVYGKDNPLTGQIVAAHFVIDKAEDLKHLRKRIWDFCYSSKIEAYKIPRYIDIAEHDLVNDRFKKLRKLELI